MNPIAQALLDAVIAEPDENLHRLAYADWLDENGQEERAEFIRLQLLLDSPVGQEAATRRIILRRDLEDSAKQRARERAIIEGAHRFLPQPLRDEPRGWAAGLDIPEKPASVSLGLGWKIEWRRGFAERISCFLAQWGKHGPGLVAVSPVSWVSTEESAITLNGRGKVRSLLVGDQASGNVQALRFAIEGCVLAERHRRDDIYAVGGNPGTASDADARGICAGLITWARTEAKLLRGRVGKPFVWNSRRESVGPLPITPPARPAPSPPSEPS